MVNDYQNSIMFEVWRLHKILEKNMKDGWQQFKSFSTHTSIGDLVEKTIRQNC